MSERTLRPRAWFGGLDKDGFIHRSWMRNFCYAGGMPAVLRRLDEAGLLSAGALTVNGATIGESAGAAIVFDEAVIRPLDRPLAADGGIAVLRGNPAPSGAVLKPSAASPELMAHDGPALVFDTVEEMKRRIDDPSLPVTPETVLVLRNCGPKGYPGMAEVGNMPIPKRLSGLYVRHVLQADKGADLDFLVGCRGADIPRESH